MHKFIFAILFYVVFTIAFGAFWNLFIFRDTYVELAQYSYRVTPILPLGMAAMFAEGVALSVLFKLFYTTEHSLGLGLLLALLVGVFSISYASLVVPAKFLISPIWKYVSLEIVFGIIHYGSVGAVYALIFRSKVTNK